MSDKDGKSKRKKPTSLGKEDPLSQALSELSEQFGDDVRLGVGTYSQIEVISTGIATVDIALGCGGIPRGRITEIFGAESGGKTTLALQIIAQHQSSGGRAAFIDVEHALDLNWAQHIGVRTGRLVFAQPNCGEDALAITETLVACGAVGLVVVDSVAALVPQKELDGELTDSNVAGQARLMSAAMRRLVGKCKKTNTALIFINQLRDKIARAMPGLPRPEITPGGRALKFYSSLRLDVRKGATLRQGEHSIGTDVKMKVAKSKVSPPFRVALFQLYFGSKFQQPVPLFGVDLAAALVQGAVEVGLVDLRGSNYYFQDQRIAIGKEAAAAALRSDTALSAQISVALAEFLSRPVCQADPDLDDAPELVPEAEPVVELA